MKKSPEEKLKDIKYAVDVARMIIKEQKKDIKQMSEALQFVLDWHNQNIELNRLTIGLQRDVHFEVKQALK